MSGKGARAACTPTLVLWHPPCAAAVPFVKGAVSNSLRQTPTGELHSAAPGPVRVVVWLASAAAMSIVLGGVALAVAQQGILPDFVFPILFPLLVGSLVGGLCAALARQSGVRRVSAILAVASACAVVCLASQEVFAYRVYRQHYEDATASNPRLGLAARGGATLEPGTFAQFLKAQIERKRLYFTVDALLTLAAALTMAWGLSQREASLGRAAAAGPASPPQP